MWLSVKDIREADRRGQELDFTEDEVAFYDALEANDSAVAVLGDENLRIIARELVETVRRNMTIDWTVKETERAKLRVMVKRILRKYRYPPDKPEKATETVMAQAELVCADWSPLEFPVEAGAIRRRLNFFSTAFGPGMALRSNHGN